MTFRQLFVKTRVSSPGQAIYDPILHRHGQNVNTRLCNSCVAQSDAIFTVSMTLRIGYDMGLHVFAALCLHVAIHAWYCVLLASWDNASFVCVFATRWHALRFAFVLQWFVYNG